MACCGVSTQAAAESIWLNKWDKSNPYRMLTKTVPWPFHSAESIELRSARHIGRNLETLGRLESRWDNFRWGSKSFKDKQEEIRFRLLIWTRARSLTSELFIFWCFWVKTINIINIWIGLSVSLLSLSLLSAKLSSHCQFIDHPAVANLLQKYFFHWTNK